MPLLLFTVMVMGTRNHGVYNTIIARYYPKQAVKLQVPTRVFTFNDDDNDKTVNLTDKCAVMGTI